MIRPGGTIRTAASGRAVFAAAPAGVPVAR